MFIRYHDAPLVLITFGSIRVNSVVPKKKNKKKKTKKKQKSNNNAWLPNRWKFANESSDGLSDIAECAETEQSGDEKAIG